MEKFEQHTHTCFDNYLDRIEDRSRRIGKQILLTFDEYEKMEEGVRTDSITREVFKNHLPAALLGPLLRADELG